MNERLSFGRCLSALRAFGQRVTPKATRRARKRINYHNAFADGAVQRKAERSNLLLVLHECSRTGAPLLGQALAIELAEKYNLLIWAGQDGEISPNLKSLSVKFGIGFGTATENRRLVTELNRAFPLKIAVVNSVESTPAAISISAAGVPILALVHEYAEYTFPQDKLDRLMLAADRCIYPSDCVMESVARALEQYRGARPRHGIVRPQGLLPAEMTARSRGTPPPPGLIKRIEGKKLVLSAAFVHIRKGVDLFIQTAGQLAAMPGGEDVHFLWIGAGYHPEYDAGYGAWIAAAIDRMGLKQKVTMLDAQASLEWAFDRADIYFLPSRLDPFPNVAVDAMQANLPIVCFDKAGGIAEFMRRHSAQGRVVPHLNTAVAAEAILELLHNPPESLEGGKYGQENSKIVEQHLNFDQYLAIVHEEMDKACHAHQWRADQVNEIDVSHFFDADFYDPDRQKPKQTKEALEEYVLLASKGLVTRCSRPGFDDLAYLAKHMCDTPPGLAPLAHALRSDKKPPRSHDCVVVDPSCPIDTSPGSVDSELNIALHAHLYYSETIKDFSRLLIDSGVRCDLFVSTKDTDTAEELGRSLQGFTSGQIQIRVTPNCGRDIGPMITEFGSTLLGGNYDLIGHLHGKKTLAQGSSFPANEWRQYLWAHLLGSRQSWNELCKSFCDDQQLGLVFPEDRRCVGWSDNLPAALNIAKRLKLSSPLPPSPIFPLGNMFWARPRAIASLLNSGLDWADYPTEPLDRDGTVLHALERLLPTICEDANYRWKTIYIRGTGW